MNGPVKKYEAAASKRINKNSKLQQPQTNKEKRL